MPRTYLGYLSILKGEVVKHFEAGLSDFEMTPLILQSLSDFQDWVDFKRNVGRHVSLVYLEVEEELF
ncbi:MAG: hypothetical protein ABW092_15640 [Candidatus Thiodiazotropha sp.]